MLTYWDESKGKISAVYHAKGPKKQECRHNKEKSKFKGRKPETTPKEMHSCAKKLVT